MKAKKVALSWVSVSDIAKSKKFFTEILGLKTLSDSEEYGWIELGASQEGAIIGLGQHRNDTKEKSPLHPGNNAIICINVDDLVATKKELEKKNVKMHGDICEVPGHVKMQLISDPDGNLFHIVEELNPQTK